MARKQRIQSTTEERLLQYPGSLYDAVKEREQNVVGRKLEAARKEAGLTLDGLGALLKKCGVSVQRGAISKWENGDTVPSIYQLVAICKVLDLEDGLAFFTRDMADSPQLNEEGRKKLAEYKIDLIASGRYRPVTMVRDNVIRYVTMPVSLLSASAGTGQFLSDESFTEEQFPADFVPEGAEFGVHVCGDSMEPVYHDGQIAWVKRCETLEPGDVGIFLYDGDGYIKVYGEQEPEEGQRDAFTDSYGQVHKQPVLISYNPAYPPKSVRPEAGFKIAGRVLSAHD